MSQQERPEYTRAEIETFIAYSVKNDTDALKGLIFGFLVCSTVFAVTLLTVEEQQTRLYVAIGAAITLLITVICYWGAVLRSRLDWLISQVLGVGQRVYDTQQKVDEMDGRNGD